MENVSYKFREATVTNIPELREMYQFTLRAVNIVDYTSEEIKDWVSCGDDFYHWVDLIKNDWFIDSVTKFKCEKW